MNRRGVALVIGVVVAIGLGAWRLSALPVEPPAGPAEARVERVEPPSAPDTKQRPAGPAPVAPPPSAPEADAGVMAELEIDVLQNWRQLIGTRVTIDGPGGRQSRPTDVMGYARFTVLEGAWRLIEPRLAERTAIEVKAPLTRHSVQLPTMRKFRGIVVDANGKPLPGIDVTYSPFGGLDRTVTDTTGYFRFESTEENVQVQARRGRSRSMMKTASPEQTNRLVLEEWTQLQVEANPQQGGRLYVRVMRRDEIVATGSDDEPLLVPVGHLSVLARRSEALLSGRAELDARAVDMNRLELDLAPTPPITGRLVDVAGRPVPGLGVHFREVPITELLEIAQTRPMTQLETLTLELKQALAKNGKGVDLAKVAASTRTNAQGEFSWRPDGTRNPDPIYQVLVVELWRTQAETVLVKLDDAPLELVVEPAAPR